MRTGSRLYHGFVWELGTFSGLKVHQKDIVDNINQIYILIVPLFFKATKRKFAAKMAANI
ncbi:hypothetical protein BCT35_15720 [Vibrio lentus]|nr:hypothetical protein BCT75_11440 [Vibrio lentus]PMN31375.1 hypothetical protein BCT35_15720 [Vibrio lentus]